ncbi:branched chain amino acid ABC transporter substrate-binding protein [Candidatus Magnetomorum sp. HK-1]|nr:branched chain amino acid ABC transporter substrate-binding protein [Candidatus Magnetomorum sp. HK-1]
MKNIEIKINLFTVIICSIVSICALIIFFLWITPAKNSQKAYEIAAVSMFNERKDDGEAMINGIKLCINSINSSGGIYGKPIHLSIYDDQGDPKEARKIASTIVKNTNTLMVLGHFLSSTSYAAGEIYKQYGIPAITGSATDNLVTRNNPWFFSVIAPNEIQGQFIAAYIYGAFNAQKANIIYNTDNYGKSLTDAFERKANELGIKILHKWAINLTSKIPINDQVKTIVEEIRSSNDDAFIFLATHSIEASKIIPFINYKGSKYKIIGSDALTTKSFLTNFKAFPQTYTKSFNFIDGIYAATPFMCETSVNKEVLNLTNLYVKKFGHKPTWIEALYYDVAKVAVSALKFSKISGMNFRKDRIEIRNYLASINEPDNSIKGLTEKIYFNKYGNAIHPFSIGFYHKQEFVPHTVQYQITDTDSNFDNAIEDVIEGDLLLIEDRLMKKGRVVYVNLIPNEISHINFKNSTFSIDFYIFLVFDGTFDVENIEFMNATTPIVLNDPFYKHQMENTTVKAYQVQGTFRTTFNLGMFPFDKQFLQVDIRHKSKANDEVILFADNFGFKLDGIDMSSKDIKMNNLDNWKVIQKKITQNCISKVKTNKTAFFSVLNMEITISRVNMDKAIRIILPIILIIIYFIANLFIPEHQLALKVIILLSVFITTLIVHIQLFFVSEMNQQITFAEITIFLLYISIIIYLILAYTEFYANNKGFKKVNSIISFLEIFVIPLIIIINILLFIQIYSKKDNALDQIDTSIPIPDKYVKKIQTDDLYWVFNLLANTKDGALIGKLEHVNIPKNPIFRIISGNTDQIFSINKQTGELFIENIEKFIKQEKPYKELSISIVGSGGDHISSIVTVCLEDLMNKKPDVYKIHPAQDIIIKGLNIKDIGIMGANEPKLITPDIIIKQEKSIEAKSTTPVNSDKPEPITLTNEKAITNVIDTPEPITITNESKAITNVIDTPEPITITNESKAITNVIDTPEPITITNESKAITNVIDTPEPITITNESKAITNVIDNPEPITNESKAITNVNILKETETEVKTTLTISDVDISITPIIKENNSITSITMVNEVEAEIITLTNSDEDKSLTPIHEDESFESKSWDWKEEK